MRQTQPRLVYDADAKVMEIFPPIECRCDRCSSQEGMPVRSMVMAGAGVLVGTIIPFAWDARGMIVVLASMVGVRV